MYLQFIINWDDLKEVEELLFKQEYLEEPCFQGVEILIEDNDANTEDNNTNIQYKCLTYPIRKEFGKWYITT